MRTAIDEDWRRRLQKRKATGQVMGDYDNFEKPLLRLLEFSN